MTGEIVKDVVGMVREKIGPVAAFKTAATIDDPAILDEIKEALQGVGYAK